MFFIVSDPGFSHSTVYYQVITQGRDSQSEEVINGSGVRISRAGLWEASAYCYFDADGNVHSSFGVEGEDPQVIKGTQEFTHKMQIALSSAFTTFFRFNQNASLSLVLLKITAIVLPFDA